MTLRKLLYLIFAPLYFFTVIAGIMLLSYVIIWVPYVPDSYYWIQWAIMGVMFPVFMVWEFTVLAVIQSVKKRLGLVGR